MAGSLQVQLMSSQRSHSTREEEGDTNWTWERQKEGGWSQVLAEGLSRQRRSYVVRGKHGARAKHKIGARRGLDF